ncbi:MAG TPA: twin-arginine translocase subunit TatC [Saprospiraceae bacterium]|nr:twin-arginine translocase subunit TatC [Saprospiraceae bacterium]HND88291.1 twin-arginine translocase subunit TatC [Saprospiraceae bacterium]HNG90185.1 twin-arginine translocase subunit TatC [Saprospiraceae bacterium]
MPLDQEHEQERLRQERGEMSFFEHINELRQHILRSALAIVAVGGVCFVFIDWIFEQIIFGPRKASFLTYRAICGLSHQVGMGDKMCFQPPQFKVITRELGEVLMQQIYVAFWLGVIGAFPFIFWEFWKFVRPGLLDKEQRAVRGIVLVCTLLFLLGVSFGFFVIAPFSISFLGGYTMEGMEVSPTLDSYVTYMTMFTLPTGLIFEMPVVAYFFTKIGVLGPHFLRTYRRHAIVLVVVIAAIITPPDVVSQILVSIPLMVLYEVSIVVAARVQRRRERELARIEMEDRARLSM